MKFARSHTFLLPRWLLVLIFGINILLGMALGERHRQAHAPLLSNLPSALNIQPSPSPSPTPSPLPVPQKLVIPKIHVDAAVEAVGEDDAGRMAVPVVSDNVGWYKFGSRLGEVGSVVLAGHLDDPVGPSVFYRLDELSVGDEIQVQADTAQTFTYRVVDKQKYPDATFPLTEVFAKTDARRLNLITCDGSFDRAAKNYSHRLVVYAELKTIQ